MLMAMRSEMKKHVYCVIVAIQGRTDAAFLAVVDAAGVDFVAAFPDDFGVAADAAAAAVVDETFAVVGSACTDSSTDDRPSPSVDWSTGMGPATGSDL